MKLFASPWRSPKPLFTLMLYYPTVHVKKLLLLGILRCKENNRNMKGIKPQSRSFNISVMWYDITKNNRFMMRYQGNRGREKKFDGIVYLITWTGFVVENSFYVNFHSVILTDSFFIMVWYQDYFVFVGISYKTIGAKNLPSSLS